MYEVEFPAMVGGTKLESRLGINKLWLSDEQFAQV